MAIQNLLSLNFLVPYVAAKNDFSRAIRGLRGMPRRLLLIGHKLSAGTAVVNTIFTVSSEADAVERFGEGSLLTLMWRAAKANADLGLPIDCIAVAPNGSAVAASATVAVTNSAGASAAVLEPGEVMLYIGGVRISVGVTTTDTQATIATKLINAINAKISLPVTAAATANTNEVAITCRWVGPTGNDIDVRSTYYLDDKLPKGLTVTTPAMASGVAAPDVTPVIAAMAGYRATEIVCPFTDSTNLGLLETEMATRWLANNMQDGAVVNCYRGTEGGISTFLSSRNSPHVHTIAAIKDATNTWETAAMAGAAIESQAAVDPAVPHRAVLVGYKGPKQGDDITVDAKNNLLQAGAMPLVIAQDYTGQLMRAVTNYTQTNLGAADRSMAELCWIKTMSYYRWFHVTGFLAKVNEGFKLAQYITDPIPGQNIMTAELAEELMLGWYKLFCDSGLCQNPSYYQDTLVVEIDGPNGKVKIVDEPVIVTQFYQAEITSYVVAGQV